MVGRRDPLGPPDGGQVARAPRRLRGADDVLAVVRALVRRRNLAADRGRSGAAAGRARPRARAPPAAVQDAAERRPDRRQGRRGQVAHSVIPYDRVGRRRSGALAIVPLIAALVLGKIRLKHIQVPREGAGPRFLEQLRRNDCRDPQPPNGDALRGIQNDLIPGYGVV